MSGFRCRVSGKGDVRYWNLTPDVKTYINYQRACRPSGVTFSERSLGKSLDISPVFSLVWCVHFLCSDDFFCPPKISDHQQSWGYEDGSWKGPGPPLLGDADFLIFFNLYFIGSIGFDDHLTDSSLASVLFVSASFGGGWSAGAYQQIVKNMQKKILSQFISRRHRSDLHSSSIPSRYR